MNDHRTTTAEIEHLLTDVRDDVVYPDAAGIDEAVRRRITSAPSPGRAHRRPSYRRPVLVAAAILLVAAVALVVAIPGSRRAVADWLGLRGIRVEQPATPDALVPAGTDLDLGVGTTLVEARRAVDFPVTVPHGFGDPDAVFLARRPAGGRVSLLYAPTGSLPPAGRDDVGMLVTEFTAEVDEAVLGKVLAVDGAFERVTVDGRPGYWISGGPHIVGLLDRDGALLRDRTRLAADTLLVQDGDRTIRIESALGEARAIEVARTLLR